MTGEILTGLTGWGVDEWLKASDSKMKNTLSQISSPLIRLDFIGDSHLQPHQPSAEIRRKTSNSIKWQYEI